MIENEAQNHKPKEVGKRSVVRNSKIKRINSWCRFVAVIAPMAALSASATLLSSLSSSSPSKFSPNFNHSPRLARFPSFSKSKNLLNTFQTLGFSSLNFVIYLFPSHFNQNMRFSLTWVYSSSQSDQRTIRTTIPTSNRTPMTPELCLSSTIKPSLRYFILFFANFCSSNLIEEFVN